MRNTVGEKCRSNKLPKLEGTPMDKIVRTLEANGYEVIARLRQITNLYSRDIY